MSTVYSYPFDGYPKSVRAILDQTDLMSAIPENRPVLLKPNLVNDMPHPVTTPPELCREVIHYLKTFVTGDIVIAEGCGEMDKETDEIFQTLGYADMARDLGICLVDLNHASLTKKTNQNCRFFPEMHLPEIAFTHYIISLPVLKAHSLSEVTGTMKNMMGFAPPSYYSGKYGLWKKAVFHEDIHTAVSDLNQYIQPDFSLIDASIGLAAFHLGGPPCNPPVNRLIAGYDPKAVDRKAAELLGLDWRTIRHLN